MQYKYILLKISNITILKEQHMKKYMLLILFALGSIQFESTASEDTKDVTCLTKTTKQLLFTQRRTKEFTNTEEVIKYYQNEAIRQISLQKIDSIFSFSTFADKFLKSRINVNENLIVAEFIKYAATKIIASDEYNEDHSYYDEAIQEEIYVQNPYFILVENLDPIYRHYEGKSKRLIK